VSRRTPPPWVLLIALAAVMAAPVPWLLPAVVGLGVGLSGLRAARRLIRRLEREPSLASALVLGRDRSGEVVRIERGELSAHGLILGASGSGKTTTLLRILSEQIRAGQPMIAIDMKGSPAFARTLAEASAAAGRPFRLWTMEGSARWNPLQYGGATELKDKLIATERFTEPHYQKAAERYLQTVLRVLLEIHRERRPTLDEVVQMMDPRRLPAALRALPREQAEQVHDYLAGLTPDQHSAIRGVQTRLALITESEAGPFLSPAAEGSEPIDVRAALSGPDVVLFSLNSSTYGNLASQLGTLVVQDVVSAMGRQLTDAPAGGALPATIAIDEFSGLGGDHVVALFARVREAGGGVLLATQEMADLDRAASGLRDQVVGNTAFKVIHRQDVPASARMVAQMAGTEPVWEQTRQLGGGPFGPVRGTRRQVDRFILDPNLIMTLGTGEAVVISKLRGERPRIVAVQAPELSGARPGKRVPAPRTPDGASSPPPPGAEPWTRRRSGGRLHDRPPVNRAPPSRRAPGRGGPDLG
jgi:type IV secretory pathway TraG/TraD family ATPase VirD4